MGIKHTKVSSKTDNADSTLVRPSDWNDDHLIDGPIDLPAGSTLDGGPFSTVPGPAGASIFKNVRDYGAAGDNVTDDTAAIQAAIDDVGDGSLDDYTTLVTGIVYFPAGWYKITSALDWSRATHTSCALVGEAGSHILGNFADYLISRPFAGTITYTVNYIQGINFVQSHASGGILFVGDSIGFSASNCTFAFQPGCNGICVNVRSDCTTFTACNFIGGGRGTTSVGLLGGGDMLVSGCDFVGNGTGLRVAGTPAGSAISCRFEVNDVGCQIGGDFTEWGASVNEPALGFNLIGGHGESNGKHIYIQNATTVSISGIYMHSFTVSPSCDYGIHVKNCSNLTIQDINTGADNYTVAAISIDPDVGHSVTNCVIANTKATVTGWDVDASVNTTSWFNTDYPGEWINKYSTYSGAFGFDVTPMTATIASGAITVTGNYMVIDTESAAASDDLDTINGAVAGNHGARLVLRAASSSRTVVIKDGTNLKLAGGDFSLDNEEDTIELIYDNALSKWLEIGRSDNGA